MIFLLNENTEELIYTADMYVVANAKPFGESDLTCYFI